MVWTLVAQEMHWTELPTTGEPPSPRSGHTAEVWGEWLVVFGGWDGDRHLQDTHLLHLETMRWLQVGESSHAVRFVSPSFFFRFRPGLECAVGFPLETLISHKGVRTPVPRSREISTKVGVDSALRNRLQRGVHNAKIHSWGLITLLSVVLINPHERALAM